MFPPDCGGLSRKACRIFLIDADMNRRYRRDFKVLRPT
jgi:hypothetical protein